MVSCGDAKSGSGVVEAELADASCWRDLELFWQSKAERAEMVTPFEWDWAEGWKRKQWMSWIALEDVLEF